jgi:hypothetical protein
VVVEVFDAGAVGADVVGAPAAAEVVAAGGQFTDQVVQGLVVGVFAGGGGDYLASFGRLPPGMRVL